MMQQFLSHFAASCTGGSFLSFPTWYKYLDGTIDANGLCTPKIDGLNDVWLIVAAIIEILLRIAVLAAVAFVIYGGAMYMTSQGEPDKTTQARHTIVNALIGLAITTLAAATVSFVAGSIN